MQNGGFLGKPPKLSTCLESLVYNFIYLIQNNIFLCALSEQ
uniref:Uncharacterized protein n=1 Tax=Siphoviridae sp. ctpbe1 TaxID=2826466 RepID=A0A8S5NNW2_9CAUD|nr:MAG TPA: hypothetical protein [Siphoviridae sp. ctpbe1]